LEIELRQSLTYDRGSEMARYVELAERTSMSIYFADPYSPWQRGSNENSNGLVRQYLPKSMDLSPLTQDQLNAIAYSLNNRPRRVLDYQPPMEVFVSLLGRAKLGELAAKQVNVQ
jgi:transposase, IS30 family